MRTVQMELVRLDRANHIVKTLEKLDLYSTAEA